MTKYPATWVINLERSVDRRELVTRRLEALGLPFELVEGVDGRDFSPEQMAAVCDFAEMQVKMGRRLTGAEVGCAISHMNLYRRQIELGLEEVLILEDDANPGSDFLRILERREDFPADWELMHLYENDAPPSFWGSKRLFGRYRVVRFAGPPYRTTAYMLRVSGAIKLVEHGYPIVAGADNLTGKTWDTTGETWDTGVRLYGVYPAAMRWNPEVETTMPEAEKARNAWWEKKVSADPLYMVKHRLRQPLGRIIPWWRI